MATMRRRGPSQAKRQTRGGDAGSVCPWGGNIGQRFVSVPAEDPRPEIAITIQDVRQVQLAKAALFAGIENSPAPGGPQPGGPGGAYRGLRGAFDRGNAVSIGMFPDLGASIKVAENAAGMGAILALLDRKRRLEATELSGGVRFVELAEDPDFQREYILGMDFPDPENPKIRALAEFPGDSPVMGLPLAWGGDLLTTFERMFKMTLKERMLMAARGELPEVLPYARVPPLV